MQWADEGFVLSVRKHGENAVIASLLTRTRGRYAGFVHGGASRRSRGIFQPGNLVNARWRARLEESLGTYRCELENAYSSRFLSERVRLTALLSATSLLDRLLPEREPHPGLFEGFRTLVEAMIADPCWLGVLVRWELILLADLGYGLELNECAVTGRTDDLIYVSPRTGRAVCREAGEEWRDRLLALPQFLDGSVQPSGTADILDGMKLTGFFLDKCARELGVRELPGVRAQLVDILRHDATTSGCG